MKRLNQNLNSSYIYAMNRLGGKMARRKIVAYVAQLLECLLGVIVVEVIDLHDVIEVEHGESRVLPISVSPYIPHEERPYRLRILLHEHLEIEDVAIVECGHYANVVERWSIASEVFYGIYIRMENIGVLAHHFGGWCSALHEVVVIGIYAGNHIVSEPWSEFVGQCYFLSFAE